MKVWLEELKTSLDVLDSLNTKDWIKEVKILDTKMLSHVKDELSSGWETGKGFESSSDITLFRDWVLKKCILKSGISPDKFSILAVGGYGRNELSPYSDIDLLILHNKNETDMEDINRFFYFLWDLGYHLGNSVRDIENSLEHAAKDVTFLTAVFESRLLWGNTALLDQLQKKLQHVIQKKRSSYIQEKLGELRFLFGEKRRISLLLKEPHLKENPGGLRGAHVAEWVYFAYEGKSGFEAFSYLTEILDASAYRVYWEAYDFILGTRNLLHLISGRKEDILSIDRQETIAALFDFDGNTKQKMITLMRKVYQSFVRIFMTSYEIVDFLYCTHEKKLPKFGSGSFLVRNGEFFINPKEPVGIRAAFRAVLKCASENAVPSFQTLIFLQAANKEIRHEDRSSKEIFDLFVDILSLDRSFQALNLLKLSGLLYVYFPEFKAVEHLIIYNPFHRFTVDEHSIQAVRTLDRLFYAEYSPFEFDKIKFLVELAESHQKALWILKLALLMHDLGKTYEGDHSRNGVEIAEKIFDVLPISYRYRGLILFLIENHLLLSQYARRVNFEDKEVLFDLAHKFMLTPYPLDYLDFLVLMTYADTFATDSKNYTGYFAVLLRELSFHLKEILTGTLLKENQNKTYQEKIEYLSISMGKENAKSFLAHMGKRYVYSVFKEEMKIDYDVLFQENLDEPKVVVQSFVEYLKVKIYSRDQIGLFSVLSGTLALHGASIVKAEIHTVQERVLDIFYITDVFGANLTRPKKKDQLEIWIENLKDSLKIYLKDPEKLEKRIQNQQRQSRTIPESFRKETNVVISTKTSSLYLLRMSGDDRRGLIYEITRYFCIHQIPVKSAIIDTVGWHVKDFFEIVLPKGFTEEDLVGLKIDLEKCLNQGRAYAKTTE